MRRLKENRVKTTNPFNGSVNGEIIRCCERCVISVSQIFFIEHYCIVLYSSLHPRRGCTNVTTDEICGSGIKRHITLAEGDIIMGHTYTHNLFHIIFSTKGRRALLTSCIEEELFKYICGIARNRNAAVICINCAKEHVHMLAKVPPSLSISDFMREVKANSSKWLSEKFPSLRLFEWQSGYSSFSVSVSMVEKVKAYIKKPKLHHEKKGFEEELINLLKKHGIEYDKEHYLD
jgi:putative transposase